MITHVIELFGIQGAGQLSGRVQMVHKYKLLCSKTDVAERLSDRKRDFIPSLRPQKNRIWE